MNKIKTILICLIAIVMTCAFCIGLIAMSEQTTTVKLSETCSINITGEYDTVFENGMNQIKIFDKFNNKEYKSIVVYSGANAGMQEIMTFGMFKSFFVGNAWDTGAEPVKTQWNGDTVYVIYTGNNITHDNILIISKNRDDCIKMYNSIKYNINKTTTNNNTTNITTTIKEETTNQQQQTNDNQQQNTVNEKQNQQNTYTGKDGKTHTFEEAYSVDYSSGDLNIINQQRRERGMSEISA